MPKRKNVHTDIEPIDQRFTVSRAQSLFLEEIRKNAPEVLESLAEISKAEFSSNLALIRALENWANSWRINADWILKIAYDTFLLFREFPLYLENSFEFNVNDIWENREILSEKIIDDLNIRPHRNENINDKKKPKIRFAESSFLIEKLFQAKIPFKKLKPELIWRFVYAEWEVALNELKLPDTPKGFRAWEADSEPRKFYLKEAESIIKREIENSIFFDLPDNLKSKIEQAKLEKIQEYCNEVVKAYLDLKDKNENDLWIKSEEKTNLKQLAEWTVKAQVLKNELVDIALDSNISESNVSRNIQQFLQLIGLESNIKRGRKVGDTYKKRQAKKYERYVKN